MAEMMDQSKSKEWNKLQADLLRHVADKIEAGEYLTLSVNNQTDYRTYLFPSIPQARRLGIQVEYVEQETEPKCTCEYPYEGAPQAGHHPSCDITADEVGRMDG
jgi:hypothetical protein